MKMYAIYYSGGIMARRLANPHSGDGGALR